VAAALASRRGQSTLSGWGGLRALGARDLGWASLRRALRVAIVVPPLAAFAGTIVGDPAASIFAVFGAFSLLGLADFGGPTIPRARAYGGAALVGVVLVLLGTLASQTAWSAVAATILVVFALQLLGVFGGYVVAAQTAVVLAFLVAVSIPVPAGAVWARMAGWALAGGISLAAGVLLWPRHARTQVRQRAGDACQALAAMLADARTPTPAADQARARVEATHQAYDQAPLRPAGPARRDRALIDLVIQLDRAHEFASRTTRAGRRHVTVPEERRLLRTIGQVLEASAGILRGGAGGPGQASAGPGQASGGAGQASAGPDLAALDRDRVAYRKALDRWAGDRLRAGEEAEPVLEGLSGGVEPRLLAHAALALAVDAAVVAGLPVDDAPLPLPHWNVPRAGPQPWVQRVRATLRTHLHPGSVWSRNSLRAALALGIAVLLARITRVDHSFWVVLGTLSVLRSNALATGRSALLAIAGTVAGFVVAALLTLALGTNRVGLWVTLPIAAFLAAYVPTVVSFLVGQAAFTLFVVVLFDLLQPQGWRLGLTRVEDVALGIAVSLVVAALLWPRGARGQLRTALAALYRADATCLDAAFGYLLGRRAKWEVDASRQAAGAEVDRAGEAFDVFLTERGSRTLPTATWGRIAAAGNDVLLAADAMEAMRLLGYRTDGCERCADRVRADAAEVVAVLTGFASRLEQQRSIPPSSRVEAAAETRDAVVGCLRAWHGAPDSPLGPTAIALATAWFWNLEIARLGTELAQPLAAVAATARTPWWR
jgi:uncharacterized membrane protein YccC